MCKKDLYKKILELTMQECELTQSQIENSRTEECSDARYILVMVAGRYYTDAELAVYLHRTRQGINGIRANIVKSRKRVVCECIKNIEQQISK